VTVFFKGCPLNCFWCHNPESKSLYRQKLYNATKCIGCRSCVIACPEQALTLDKEKGIITDIEKCKLCGTCASVCPAKATEMSGEEMNLEKIMAFIKKETVLMDSSEGGVTFSGGEPLYHSELLLELLKECGREGIHRVVDTSGFTKTETLLEVAQHTELFLYDLKHMDSLLHKQFTGVPNETILSNLKALSENGSEINIRIPLIEGVNADEKNMKNTAAFVSSLPGKAKTINLLPYHSIASRKYEKLGLTFNEDGLKEPSKETISNCENIFTAHGLKTIVGG
jgi:pyruvate formate lyase activating enzyme